nr:hypothetical protein [Nocardia jiangxiensis]
MFSTSIEKLVGGLRAAGLQVEDAAPGITVRDRLAERYGVDALEVGAVRIRVPAPDGSAREVEVFSATPRAELAEPVDRERVERNEFHLTLHLDAPDEVTVAGLRALLISEGGLVADGSGYDPGADRTTLYFRSWTGWRGHRRLALRLPGRRGAAVARLERAARAGQATAGADDRRVDHPNHRGGSGIGRCGRAGRRRAGRSARLDRRTRRPDGRGPGRARAAVALPRLARAGQPGRRRICAYAAG